MKKMRRSYIVMLVAVVITALAVLFARNLSRKNKEGGPGGRRGTSTVFSVKTALLEKTVLHDYVSTNGEVEAQSSIEVFPDIGGKVVSVKRSSFMRTR